MARNTPATRPAPRPVTRRNTPATRPATRGAPDTTAVTVLEAPPAADPQTDVERASAALSLVSNRLVEAQADLVELRRSIAETAFLAEVDPSNCMPALLDLRSRLAAAESRVDELTAAESVGRDMAAEAQRRALEARRNADWAAVGDLLSETMVSAAAIDSLLQQAGALYQDLLRKQAEAVAKIRPHVSNDLGYVIQPPDLDLPLRMVIGNAGGPAVAEGEVLHLDAAQRDQITLAAVVANHNRRVLGYRPMDTTKQEEVSRD